MVPYSSTGYAKLTEPIQGFEDPKLTQIFASRAPQNNTTTAATIPATTTPATTTPDTTTTLPPKDYPHNKIPVGAIAGGIVGGFVLVLLFTAFLILHKRQRQMVEPPQPIPELTSIPFNPQELQAWEVRELSHGIREDTELPSAPIDI